MCVRGWSGLGEGEEGGSGIGKVELKILIIECLLCVKHWTTAFHMLHHFIFTTIVKSLGVDTYILPKRKNVRELCFSLLWVQLRVESRAMY